MKKLIYAAAMVAMIGSFTVSQTSCSKGEKADAAADTTAVAQVFSKEADAFEPTTNIRYYELDSVLANYDLVKMFNESSRKTMVELQSAQNNAQAELQRLQSNIENKARANGYLTEASYNADVEAAQKKAAALQRSLAEREAKAQQEAMGQQIEVFDSIHSFLVDFNAEHHYDAILTTQPGQLFNPALNITDEVVKGLNDRYKKSHPAE